IRPEIFALRISGDLAEISLQLLLAGSPGEIGIRLRESELGQRLHDLWSGESLRQKNDAGIDRLHLVNEPLPEFKRLGGGVVDSGHAHTLLRRAESQVL